MAIHQTCDGVVRRDFLKAGVIGATGLTLARYLELSAAGAVSKTAKAKAAIFVNLPGGPSHMDSFDLKPNAPTEYRGLFNPIKTNADGVEICEHLPKLAKCADKFVLLRGVSHALGAHALGQEYVNTGTRPIPSLQYPGYGSIVTKEMASAPDLPPYVAIPNHNFGGGYLGVKYAPLATGATPRQGQPFSVRGVPCQRSMRKMKPNQSSPAFPNPGQLTVPRSLISSHSIPASSRISRRKQAMTSSSRSSLPPKPLYFPK